MSFFSCRRSFPLLLSLFRFETAASSPSRRAHVVRDHSRLDLLRELLAPLQVGDGGGGDSRAGRGGDHGEKRNGGEEQGVEAGYHFSGY